MNRNNFTEWRWGKVPYIYIHIHTYRANLSAVSKVQYIRSCNKTASWTWDHISCGKHYLKDLKTKCCNTPLSLWVLGLTEVSSCCFPSSSLIPEMMMVGFASLPIQRSWCLVVHWWGQPRHRKKLLEKWKNFGHPRLSVCVEQTYDFIEFNSSKKRKIKLKNSIDMYIEII